MSNSRSRYGYNVRNRAYRSYHRGNQVGTHRGGRSIVYGASRDTDSTSEYQQPERGSRFQTGNSTVHSIPNQKNLHKPKRKINNQGGRGNKSQPTFCNYCGQYVVEGDGDKKDEEVFHRECLSKHIPQWKEVVEEFKLITANRYVLWMGIHVAYLYGQGKGGKNKEQRDIKIKELLKKVTALRNSDSGFILIQLVGLEPDDSFTGAFDEFADVKLNSLINDGSSFADVYKKKRLSAYQGFEGFGDILVLFVKGADFLITSDFKTKSALDDCIVDTPDLTLLKFLQDRKQFQEKHHKISINIPDDLKKIQESRYIQTKSVFEDTSEIEKIKKLLFDKLRLAEYISAFQKNNHGGSYLLGIKEENCERGTELYQSKKYVIKPVTVKNGGAVVESIKTRVSETLLVCDYDGLVKPNSDLIEITFIPVTAQTQTADTYIMHISVRSVSGIVFYDKKGPMAFRVVEKPNEKIEIERVSLKDWFWGFQQRLLTRK